MEYEKDLEHTLTFLTKVQSNFDFSADLEKIQTLSHELQNIKTDLPTKEKVDELKKIENDLEIKYEIFYELGNLFDPLYIKVNRKIHDVYVKKLRKNNRKKRDID